MAAASYAGGRLSGWIGGFSPTVAGLAIAATGFGLMWQGWSATSSYPMMAAHLVLVGVGIGLVLAPMSVAVINAAPDSDRGSAASLVIVFRLIGFSVGLAGLTAWGLHRYNELRRALTLPALGSPGYEAALTEAAVDITTTALAETFLGAGLAIAIGWVIAVIAVDRRRPTVEPQLASDPVPRS